MSLRRRRGKGCLVDNKKQLILLILYCLFVLLIASLSIYNLYLADAQMHGDDAPSDYLLKVSFPIIFRGAIIIFLALFFRENVLPYFIGFLYSSYNIVGLLLQMNGGAVFDPPTKVIFWACVILLFLSSLLLYNGFMKNLKNIQFFAQFSKWKNLAIFPLFFISSYQAHMVHIFPEMWLFSHESLLFASPFLLAGLLALPIEIYGMRWIQTHFKPYLSGIIYALVVILEVFFFNYGMWFFIAISSSY